MGKTGGFVCCSYLALICAGCSVLLSIASTVSCEYFAVQSKNDDVDGLFGLWGRHNDDNHGGLLSCSAYSSEQAIDSFARAARSMSIVAPFLCTVAILWMWWAEKDHLVRPSLNTHLAITTLLFIAATLCQLCTLLVLDSSLCQDNYHMTTTTTSATKIFTKSSSSVACKRLYGARTSIAATSLMGAACVFALFAMSKQQYYSQGIVEDGAESKEETFMAEEDDAAIVIPTTRPTIEV